MENRIYMCIDLKSFFASCECVDRKLDPLNTNLVVADGERTEKTICLAVTPSLKKYGIASRSRLFEVVQAVKQINNTRKRDNKYKPFSGKSYFDSELSEHPEWELDYITATPRMGLYMKYSTQIYNIYLKYISADDIFVYSIDEVFIDVTSYLDYYKTTPEELMTKMISDVYHQTGITATGGIGTNPFLAKVAMDVVAKHAKPNAEGVRVATLNEETFRRTLWGHRPLSDIWRIGPQTEKKLAQYGIYTLGDIALHSLKNEELLYKLFGVNAELLIDHAWGYEPSTFDDIRAYKPASKSISQGQVLHRPYNFTDCEVIVREMMDLLALDLVSKRCLTNQLVLEVGYDIECVTNPDIRKYIDGEICYDHYGRAIPGHAHGTVNVPVMTNSSRVLTEYIVSLYKSIVNEHLLVRRLSITASKVVFEENYEGNKYENNQLSLFADIEEEALEFEEEEEKRIKDNKIDTAVVSLKKKYGKNAVLKGMNLLKAGTTIERNGQIGGHKA